MESSINRNHPLIETWNHRIPLFMTNNPRALTLGNANSWENNEVETHFFSLSALCLWQLYRKIVFFKGNTSKIWYSRVKYNPRTMGLTYSNSPDLGMEFFLIYFELWLAAILSKLKIATSSLRQKISFLSSFDRGITSRDCWGYLVGSLENFGVPKSNLHWSVNIQRVSFQNMNEVKFLMEWTGLLGHPVSLV